MIEIIDKDTIKITTTSEEIIKISDLEKKLTNTKLSNILCRKIQEFYDSSPDEMKPFIMLMPEEDEKELEDKIKLYKG